MKKRKIIHKLFDRRKKKKSFNSIPQNRFTAYLIIHSIQDRKLWGRHQIWDIFQTHHLNNKLWWHKASKILQSGKLCEALQGSSTGCCIPEPETAFSLALPIPGMSYCCNAQGELAETGSHQRREARQELDRVCLLLRNVCPGLLSSP